MYMYIPCLRFGVLPMGVRYLTPTLSFECSGYRLWIQESFDCGSTHFICVPGLICRRNYVIAPTFLSMFAHITCQFRVAFIQEPSNPTRLVLACLGSTVEYMAMVAFDVLDNGGRLEKSVNRSSPLLGELLW
jgi:hypothetical protein